MSISTEEFRRVGSIVTNWRAPLLFTHVNPDGDALGCLVTMRSVLRRLGAQPTAITFGTVPRQYNMLIEREPIPEFNDAVSSSELDRADGVLIMDTCALKQLEPISQWLQRAQCPKVVLDHHVTRDSLADEYLIDEAASASCLLIHEWACACGWSIDAATAQALYIGIATDTGWFRFSNCDDRTHRAAAELIARGVSPDVVYRRIEESESVERVRLLGEALNAMELDEDNRLAIMPITRELFAKTRTGPQDTENLINQAMRIESVEVAVLIADVGEGSVKASFRSKGKVDVARLAAGFGGGGHVRAAGARFKDSLLAVKERIHAAIKQQLQD